MLNINPPESVLSICRTLRAAGFEAWIVGGAVRDSLLGKEPHDWDIATNALPNETVALFERVIETGIAHGTVTVLDGSSAIEVTTNPSALRWLMRSCDGSSFRMSSVRRWST
jgi:tRNA nucleotidyltransferase (CCA-adding enzyme)